MGRVGVNTPHPMFLLWLHPLRSRGRTLRNQLEGQEAQPPVVEVNAIWFLGNGVISECSQ